MGWSINLVCGYEYILEVRLFQAEGISPMARMTNSRFEVISSIQVASENSWIDKMFLTFDIDWAHDDILGYTLDLVENRNLAATWFMTHETPLLDRLRANASFELGIHPNFNYLLQNDTRNGRSATLVAQKLLDIVPEAKSVRSHSLLQSGPLLEMFEQMGLTHECNYFIPWNSDINLRPWIPSHSIITRVPHFWEDDVACLDGEHHSITELSNSLGLKVFDFHPIHVFLNTESLDRYELTRPFHNNPKELIKHRYDGYGTRNRLLDLLNIREDV